MRTPQMKPREKLCAACNGTGHVDVAKSAKPTVRIYPPQCKECLGKGRVTDYERSAL
jgi:DnaJ-class molecular chaperone